jgi:hypothetical protein
MDWRAWSAWPLYRNAARAGLYWAGSANLILLAAEVGVRLTERRLLWTIGTVALTVLAQFLVWPVLCLVAAGLIRATRYVVGRLKVRALAT